MQPGFVFAAGRTLTRVSYQLGLLVVINTRGVLRVHIGGAQVNIHTFGFAVITYHGVFNGNFITFILLLLVAFNLGIGVWRFVAGWCWL
jgi:hypothetical protein